MQIQEIDVDSPVTEEKLEEALAAAEAKPVKKETPSEPFVMEAVAFASAVEAVLFAAERPASFDRIRDAFGSCCPNNEQLTEVIATIAERYQGPERGFTLRKAQGGYHFVTKMENAEYIRRFQAAKPFRLGRSALEVLAIIAYRQPITRAEIDQVRGIDSSHLLRTLIERGLVRMAGKAEVPGRPVQYGTTERFLEVIGLTDPSMLPPLSELQQLQGDTEDPQKRMDEGLDKFMRPALSDAEANEEVVVVGEDGNDPLMNEIESLISTAEGAPKEVYASPIHRDVAEANREALEAFQSASRRRPRKPKDSSKSVTFEDLVGADGTPPVES